MSKTKLPGRENLPKYAYCLGPVGPIDKENQAKMYKMFSFRFISYHYLFETVRIRIRTKQSDPDLHQIEKLYPDPYQSEKQDPD
jgi:hypothetical protein